jgi:hypothetical protein
MFSGINVSLTKQIHQLDDRPSRRPRPVTPLSTSS